jgi:hypothetical protein
MFPPAPLALAGEFEVDPATTVDELPAAPALAGASFAVGLEELAPPHPKRVRHAVALTQLKKERRNSAFAIFRAYGETSNNAHRDFSWISIRSTNQRG